MECSASCGYRNEGDPMPTVNCPYCNSAMASSVEEGHLPSSIECAHCANRNVVRSDPFPSVGRPRYRFSLMALFSLTALCGLLFAMIQLLGFTGGFVFAEILVLGIGIANLRRIRSLLGIPILKVTALEFGVLLMVCGILHGLTFPAVQSNCPSRRTRAAVASPVGPTASAQLEQEEQQRCEAILLKAIESSEQPTLYTIGLCKHVPIGRVGAHLESALKSMDPSVRLAAADFCIEHSPEQFRQSIVESMNDIQLRFDRGSISLSQDFPAKSQDEKVNAITEAMLTASNEMRLPSQAEVVHRAAVLMRLGDAKAKETVEAWVKQDLSVIKETKWICPMMCVHPSSNKGKCAVCSMELVKVPPEFTEEDWQARIEAIRAYQQAGNRVATAARSIVISEASPHVRLLAADIWSKEAPADALPHIAVFLHGDNREFALELLSVSMPARFTKELEAVAHAPDASLPLRLSAYEGLLRCGNSELLSELRTMIDAGDTKGNDSGNKELAMLVMTAHAEAEDVVRLKRLLKSKYQVLAAEALLTLGRKENLKH